MTPKDEYPREMTEALEKFRLDAEQIIGPDSPFVKSLTSQPPPEHIYHYTDDVGLNGILESGKLWLTEIRNLNDPSELHHGFDIAVRELKEMVSGGSPESRKFAADLEFIAKKKTIQKSADFFICSLSLCGDDLGQWRAYADNGRGFALEFDATALEGGFPHDSFPLKYDDSKLAELDRRIIEKMLHLAHLPSYKDALSIAFMTYATNVAIFFKHTAYRNEMEYKFLETHSADAAPTVGARRRPYSLIRYREYDWRSVASSALTRIVVGPAADQNKAAQFAEDCLALFHPPAKNVEILRSAIPYRVL